MASERSSTASPTSRMDDISNDLLDKSILYEEILDELHDCLRTGEAVCSNVVRESPRSKLTKKTHCDFTSCGYNFLCTLSF